MKPYRLAFIVFLVTLTFSQIAFAKKSLSLSATSNKEAYLEGEPIVFRVVITNTGTEDIRHYWFCTVNTFFYKIFDTRKERVKDYDTGGGHVWYARCYKTLGLGESVQTSIEILDGDPIRRGVSFRGQNLMPKDYKHGERSNDRR